MPGKKRTADGKKKRSSTKGVISKKKAPQKVRRYAKKVREPDNHPTAAQLKTEGDVPRKASNLFSVKLQPKKLSSFLDNGDSNVVGDDLSHKEGRKTINTGSNKAEKARQSVLLEKQLPNESFSEFDKRLRRGVEQAMKDTNTKPAASEGRKRRNQRRKEKAKKPKRTGRDQDADPLHSRSLVVGLAEPAMEPPKLSVVPKER